MTRRLLLASCFLCAVAASAQGPIGYYRQPAIHGDTVVFVAEGDLWRVGVEGGAATRLTSHPGAEEHPEISPDGATVAFVGHYEGAAEVYTMPLAGGLPTRRSWGGEAREVASWAPDGRVIYSTYRFSTLPETQLVALDVSGEREAPEPERIPLAQASDGWYAGETLFFTRFPFQGSHTKRYRGGIVQSLWRFGPGDDEARPLTLDHTGTSKRAMVWKDRVVFASDRDGTMNLWSMDFDGADLRQLTRHEGFDVSEPDLESGRVVYRIGADLRLFDLASGTDRGLEITLDSDLDQAREHWIEKPMDYLTAVHLAPDGEKVVITARGQVFVAPRKAGRFVVAGDAPGARRARP